MLHVSCCTFVLLLSFLIFLHFLFNIVLTIYPEPPILAFRDFLVFFFILRLSLFLCAFFLFFFQGL